MIKQVLIVTPWLILSLATVLSSQSYTAKFSNDSGNKQVKFALTKGAITVIGHNRPEVIISTDDYYSAPKRAKGLRSISMGVEDNSGIGLEVVESGNIMTIKSASNRHMAFELKVPKEANIYVEELNFDVRGIDIAGISGEIEIDAKHSTIQIRGSSGPVVASTVNGDIEVIFDTINQDQPNFISCTNGFIDVTIPGNTKSDIDMKSINGEIYTDLKLDVNQNKYKDYYADGTQVIGTLNGGGVEISLRAINSNIYLRKAE